MLGAHARAPSSAASPSPSTTPFDLTSISAGRLAVAAVILAVAYTCDWAINACFTAADAPSGGFPMTHAAAGLTVGAALVVFVVARWGRLSSRSLYAVAIAFEVVASLGIAFDEQWEPWAVDETVRGISWTCAWITIYPVIVPMALGRAWAGAIASATTIPLALGITIAARGHAFPSVAVLVDLFEPALLIAVLAPLAARIVYRLGRDVARARRFGGYELVERLGGGGMGEVWRARHQMLIRPAAVKVVRPEALHGRGGPGLALRRFRREAQATASLSSPHTVALYDLGPTQGGGLYYAMELIDGLDLETLVRRHGPLPPERVVHLLRQACHSLADAHRMGLVHRDVKPSNLMVGPRGVDHDFLKVLDFGLVRALDPTVVRDVTTTVDGAFSGTPAFMAPEMATVPGAVDHRADLYSLGCVAYWMLTGRLVFEATNPVEMVLQHVRDVPAPPSTLAEVAIPAALERLVLDLLAKDRHERPDSASVVAERLAAIAPAAAWTPERAAWWWRSRRPALIEAAEPPVTVAARRWRVVPETAISM